MSVRETSPMRRWSSSTTCNRPVSPSSSNASISAKGVSGSTVSSSRRIHALTCCPPLPAPTALIGSRYLMNPSNVSSSASTGTVRLRRAFMSASASSMVSVGRHADTCSARVIRSAARACSGTWFTSIETACCITPYASSSTSSSPACGGASRVRNLIEAAAAARWPPPFHRERMAWRSTARPSARAEQRPMSEKKGCSLALVCSTPSSTTSHASSCSNSVATAAMPVTKPCPVLSTVQPMCRPSCSASRISSIACESRSRCTADRRGCPNSATALCETPWSISQARACASRGVVAGKVSWPVSARMPSAKSVASVSVSSSGAAVAAAPGSPASARSLSTRTVVAEPTSSSSSSLGLMSPPPA
mmetsp:Transcript_57401/g.131764  ORF Transcript_57401/g.131764 Transcript_57401/m.131764 type:complete len:363 (+) Transcript_57401:168-1256(+)